MVIADSAWDVYNLVEAAIAKIDLAMLALERATRADPS
jgi:hypothetical protein